MIHRTAKDFLQSKPIWATILDATEHENFNPEQRWANAYLRILKISDRSTPIIEDVWDTLTWCLEYALRLEEESKTVQKDYLDEVGRVAIIVRHQYRTSRSKVDPFIYIGRRSVVKSFLAITTYFYMDNYVRIRSSISTCEDVENARDCIKQRNAGFGQDDWIVRKTALRATAETPGGEGKTYRALSQKPERKQKSEQKQTSE